MSELPISVCIIAKNEEKYIENCLKKLKPYGFEIIVTDTGSTDRTKEIATKYADKVFDFEWINDFSAARNFCASKASHNWILSIDCDEYVNNMDVDTLIAVMNKYPQYVGVIRMKNLIRKNNGESGYGSDDVLRFYNRKYYCYNSPVHEQIGFRNESKINESITTFLLPMEVIHHGYFIEPEEMEKKQKRNLQLLYASLEKNQEDAYIHFQIGQSEFILGNYENAIKYFKSGIELNSNLEHLYVQIMVESLAKTYMVLDQKEEALEIMERFQDKCKTARFTFTYANILLNTGQPLKALLYFVKITMMNDAELLGENLLNCYKHIVELYTDMGNEEMANLFRGKIDMYIKERDRVLNS